MVHACVHVVELIIVLHACVHACVELISVVHAWVELIIVVQGCFFSIGIALQDSNRNNSYWMCSYESNNSVGKNLIGFKFYTVPIHFSMNQTSP